MQNTVKDYKIELANKKYIDRTDKNTKLGNIKGYWKEFNNIAIIEPFQNEIAEESILSRKDAINKTGDGSITPKTHIYETSAYLDKDKSTFVTEYAYADQQSDLQSHVVRFGINTKNDETKKFVENFNTQTHSTYKGSIGSKKSLKPDEINRQIEVAKNNITDIEKGLVKHAKQKLLHTDKTTALVDIFARDAKGNINLEDKIPETHTVVLYKQSDKYLVIDPSNATFSTILSGIEDVICCFSSNMQIYKPAGETGQGSWRDCIDIAVKLAFAINKTLPDLINDIGDKNCLDAKVLKNIEAVKIITNQQEQYQHLPKIVEKEYVRSKQSSNLINSKLTTLYLKVFNNYNLSIEEKLDAIDAYTFRELLAIQNKKSVANEDNKNNAAYVENLKSYNSKLSVLLSKLDADEHVLSLEEKAIMGKLDSESIGEWNYE